MQLQAKILSLSVALLTLAGCSAGSDLGEIKTSAGQMETNTKKIDTDLNKFSASTKEETASQKQSLLEAQAEAKSLKAEMADLKTSTDAISNALDKTVAEQQKSAVNSSSGVVKAVAAVKEELQNVGKQLQAGTSPNAANTAAATEMIQEKAFQSHKNREEQFDVFKKAQGLQDSIKEAQVYVCLFDFQNLDEKTAAQMGVDLASVKVMNMTDFLGDMQSIAPDNTSDLNLTSLPDTTLFKFNILAYAMSLECPSVTKTPAPTKSSIQSVLREVLAAEKNHPSASAGVADLFQAKFLPYAYQVAHNAQTFLALRLARKASGNSEDPHWWQLLFNWTLDLSKATAADTRRIQNQMQSAISFEKDLQDLFNTSPQFDSSVQRWIETMQKTSDNSSVSASLYDLIATTYHHGVSAPSAATAGVWQ